MYMYGKLFFAIVTHAAAVTDMCAVTWHFDHWSNHSYLSDCYCNVLPAHAHPTMFYIHLVFVWMMLTQWFPQEHFFTPETYGDIIYEHFLFDIPKLLDLCALYGGANKALLGKMVGNVFERQPKYQDDLQTCIQSILMVSVHWDTLTLSYTKLHWVTLSYIKLH